MVLREALCQRPLYCFLGRAKACFVFTPVLDTTRSFSVFHFEVLLILTVKVAALQGIVTEPCVLQEEEHTAW